MFRYELEDFIIAIGSFGLWTAWLWQWSAPGDWPPGLVLLPSLGATHVGALWLAQMRAKREARLADPKALGVQPECTPITDAKTSSEESTTTDSGNPSAHSLKWWKRQKSSCRRAEDRELMAHGRFEALRGRYPASILWDLW